MFILRGQLDAEGGALVKTAIDALAHGLSRGESRTGSQRRADALVDMAAMQLRCGDHRDVHGQRPHLTLTVSAETLRSDALTADTMNGEAARSSSADAAPAVLGGVGPIHPETARRIACDAVRTVVTVAPPAHGSAWTGSGVPCRSRSDGLPVRSRHTSGPRSTSATRAAASRGATARRRGPTATTSGTGRTVGIRRSRILFLCAGRTIARCTSRGGAFTSLMALPWWNRRPDDGAAQPGGVEASHNQVDI